MHLFVHPLSMMYVATMMYFYQIFKLLEGGSVSSEIRGVDLLLNAEISRDILKVLLNGFDRYVRCEWPNL